MITIIKSVRVKAWGLCFGLLSLCEGNISEESGLSDGECRLSGESVISEIIAVSLILNPFLDIVTTISVLCPTIDCKPRRIRDIF